METSSREAMPEREELILNTTVLLQQKFCFELHVADSCFASIAKQH